MPGFARTVFLILGVLASAAASLAVADNGGGPDPSVTREREIRHYVVQQDGSFVLNHEIVLLINEERAIRQVAQQPIQYNRTLETLEVTEAHTQKPDGRKITITTDQIRDQQEPASTGAPMFHDTLLKTVIFPEVAVGDRLVLKFRRTRTSPLFPGHFEQLFVPVFNPINALTLIFDMPAALTLHSDSVGFHEAPPKTAGDRRIYRWEYLPVERRRIEQNAVAFSDYGQRLAVSTFANYAAFARAYEARAADKIVVTAKIRELAEEVAGKFAEPRQQALALSDWVRRNIRYVAVYLGAGGIVPHASESILDNRYGDCKDHVVLLNAMLAARGIEATSALINSGNAYQWPKVPTLGVLNHAITYIPALDLYLDATAKNVAAGYLPASELDKPVALTRSGETARTPARQIIDFRVDSQFNIRSDGSASFIHALVDAGATAESSRFTFRNIREADRNLIGERVLHRHGLKGSAKIEVGDLQATGDRHEVVLKGRIENLVSLPGPVGIPTHTSLAAGILDRALAFGTGKVRFQPYICYPVEATERARYAFPDEVEIIAFPKVVTIKEEGVEYSADYSRDGNAVVIERRYRTNHNGAVCAPKTYARLRSAYDAMIRDLRSQIIVQAK